MGELDIAAAFGYPSNTPAYLQTSLEGMGRLSRDWEYSGQEQMDFFQDL
jgi:hypothetical protein